MTASLTKRSRHMCSFEGADEIFIPPFQQDIFITMPNPLHNSPRQDVKHKLSDWNCRGNLKQQNAISHAGIQLDAEAAS